MLCSALQELRDAHDEQLDPLVTSLIEGGMDEQADMDLLREPKTQERLGAIAAVFFRNADAVDKAVFPGNPQLVVELERAYAGYGSGIVALKKLADDPDAGTGELLDPLHELFDANTHLDAAIDQADLAKAAGTLTCP